MEQATKNVQSINHDIPTTAVIEVNKANELIAKLEKSPVIKSQAEAEAANAVLKTIKTKIKEIENERFEITRPMDEAKKRVMEFFKKPLDMLASHEKTIKGAVALYIEEENRKARLAQAAAEEKARKEREKLEARAEKAAEKGNEEKANELLMQAETTQAPVIQQQPAKLEGTSLRYTYNAEVTDLMLLVKAVAEGRANISCLQINQMGINSLAKALKENFDVPGCKLIKTPVVSSR